MAPTRVVRHLRDLPCVDRVFFTGGVDYSASLLARDCSTTTICKFGEAGFPHIQNYPEIFISCTVILQFHPVRTETFLWPFLVAVGVSQLQSLLLPAEREAHGSATLLFPLLTYRRRRSLHRRRPRRAEAGSGSGCSIRLRVSSVGRRRPTTREERRRRRGCLPQCDGRRRNGSRAKWKEEEEGDDEMTRLLKWMSLTSTSPSAQFPYFQISYSPTSTALMQRSEEKNNSATTRIWKAKEGGLTRLTTRLVGRSIGRGLTHRRSI